MTAQIVVRGARLHNLKNITLSIPKNQLVVLTGVSGSGKSTLGFDLLYKEGQRQYLESLGYIAFDLARPPVDSISGLSPSISVNQQLTNRNPRSTVGTVTDVYTYLRVLFARLGHRPCPVCGLDVPPAVDPLAESWEADSIETDADDRVEKFYQCPHCAAPVKALGMANFSFNKPAGACPTCTGLGSIHKADIAKLVDERKSILDGGVVNWDAFYIDYYSAVLKAAASHYGFEYDLSLPVRLYLPQQRDLLLFGVESAQFRRHYPDIEPPLTVREGHFEGIATNLLRRYADRIQDMDYREKMERYLVSYTCPDCAGTRLAAESRMVTVHRKDIIALSRMSLSDLAAWLEALTPALTPDEMIVAYPVLEELKARIPNLINTGVSYISLERPTPSLSVGEAQRLRLAALLGSGLSGVLYVLDEPTIGTHQRDTRRLIDVLRNLRDLGNTVLVVEHDLDMIAAADYVIDFGPGGGKNGGQVIATGTPLEVAANTASLTGGYLCGRKTIPVPQKRRSPVRDAIVIRDASHHNLKHIDVRLPLGMLVVVTGVSGSGKSSLIFDILDRALRQRLYGSNDEPGKHVAIEGWEAIRRIITIDQQQIGRIPRSNVATYSEIFTPIREAFSSTPDARRLGLSARHFSFNVPGGRCERCQGSGELLVKMHFLPDEEIRCPTCHGRRFTRQTLEVRYREHDMSQVLNLTVDEALTLFGDIPTAVSRLQVLADVGLGYLQLGQPVTTLSGGEAQRVKLSKELGRRGAGHALYLFDEPTTGLHLADIVRLLQVLQRLIDAGNSVVVIEHNLQLIKTSDWIIDLGPEGGEAGGWLVAQGTPEDVALESGSFTGQLLRNILEID